MAANPMHQFKVFRIGPEIKFGNIDLSFTNASLFMLISALTICLFFFLGSKRKKYCARKITAHIRIILQLYS